MGWVVYDLFMYPSSKNIWKTSDVSFAIWGENSGGYCGGLEEVGESSPLIGGQGEGYEKRYQDGRCKDGRCNKKEWHFLHKKDGEDDCLCKQAGHGRGDS